MSRHLTSFLSRFRLCRSRVKERSVKQWKTSNLKKMRWACPSPDPNWPQLPYAKLSMSIAGMVSPKSSGHKAGDLQQVHSLIPEVISSWGFYGFSIFGIFWNISRLEFWTAILIHVSLDQGDRLVLQVRCKVEFSGHQRGRQRKIAEDWHARTVKEVWKVR